MTPDGQQDLAAVMAEMREAAVEHTYGNNCVRIARWADRLALLLVEAHPQDQEKKEVTDTRVVDLQYDPPSARPLATAAQNQTVPATCASCGVSIHRYGVRLVRLGDGTWICADCFYQQRDVPKG